MIKNLKIGTKLILGFSVAAAVIGVSVYFVAVGETKKALELRIAESSELLAENIIDKIDREIRARLDALRSFARSPSVQKAIIASNVEFEKLPDKDSYIKNKDGEWRAAQVGGITPFIESLINNSTSDFLRDLANFYSTRDGESSLPEIFITNKYGANVAQTGVTSDYYQADEEWWQDAKEKGFSVSDVAYDESASVYSIDIGVRVNDVKENFIGVMKVILRVEEIVSLLKEYDAAETGIDVVHDLILLTQDGRLIYSTENNSFGLLKDVSLSNSISKILELRESASVGYVVAGVGVPGEAEKLLAYAVSRGYREYSGLNWILIISHDTDEVFRPIEKLKFNLALLTFIAIFVLVLGGFAVSRRVTKPLKSLNRTLREFGSGELSRRSSIVSGDEVGQLALEFNKMAEELEKKYVELGEFNKKLEKSVLERTNQLETANEHMALLLQSFPSVLFTAKAEGDYGAIYISQNVNEVTGYTAEEFTSDSSFWANHVHPDDRQRVLKSSADVLTKGLVYHEYRFQKKDGSYIWVGDISRLVRWPNGSPRHVSGVWTDITKRKKGEDLAQKLREELVSFVSHQLRAPITVIGGNAELLSGSADSLAKEQKEYIAEIENANLRMKRLVEDFLNVSRVESGKIKKNLIPTKIEDFIQKIISETNLEKDSGKCRVVFDKPKEEIPEVPLDHSLMRQVINNLLTNAIKYSSESKCDVVVAANITDKKELVISVKDSGIGIPKDDQPKVFEKFYRAENAVKAKADGVGLGLYVVRIIVEALGGKIRFESEEGTGTTFYVSVPLTD